MEDKLVRASDIFPALQSAGVPYNYATRRVIEQLPAVDAVEKRRGHWVRHYNADIGWHTCSECGEEIWNPDIGREKYCWNCGAKMDGEDGDA